MHPLIDSHIHLDAVAFEHDRDDVVDRASDQGVRSMILPATDAASWTGINALCREYPGIHPAYGLHPVFLQEHEPGHLQMLSSWLSTHRAVAVGEIGLDFHTIDLDRDLQRDYFKAQLDIARQFELPVIVHARDALEEVEITLRRSGGLRGVVHSFSGSEQQARRLWDIGFHLGIGGPVTYERAQRLRRIVATMPIEFLLLESDAPDQPDAMHRGQRNEPARITEVLSCVAGLRGESEQSVAEATSANATRLFGLEPTQS
jgi:TatD DNase family protein